jgi:hypothetical protein
MEDVSTMVTLASVMLLVVIAVGVTYFLFEPRRETRRLRSVSYAAMGNSGS